MGGAATVAAWTVARGRRGWERKSDTESVDFRRYARPLHPPTLRRPRTLILRGIKTIEYRSRLTRIIGERFYIYAAKKWALDNGHPVLDAAGATNGGAETSHDGLTRPRTPALEGGGTTLPTGVIVGSAGIAECVRNGRGYEWHLVDVKRLKRPRKPKRQPQPVWFNPF